MVSNDVAKMVYALNDGIRTRWLDGLRSSRWLDWSKDQLGQWWFDLTNGSQPYWPRSLTMLLDQHYSSLTLVASTLLSAFEILIMLMTSRCNNDRRCLGFAFLLVSCPLFRHAKGDPLSWMEVCESWWASWLRRTPEVNCLRISCLPRPINPWWLTDGWIRGADSNGIADGIGVFVDQCLNCLWR